MDGKALGTGSVGLQQRFTFYWMTPNLDNFQAFAKNECKSVSDMVEILLIMSKEEFQAVVETHIGIGQALLETMPIRARFENGGMH
jgi:hypothetical protein